MRVRPLRDRVALVACLVVFVSVLSLGCRRDTNGNVVKGPVAVAALHGHRLDPEADGGAGARIASSVTGIDGSMRRLEIPVVEFGPVVIVAEGGIDIATFRPPVVPRLRTLLAHEEPALQGPVHATPLTTLTLELAGRIADLDVGFYAGNADGERTTLEYLDAVRIAEARVRESFGLGLLDDAHLFASPAVLTEEATTLEAQSAALAHRIAVEAFAAFLVGLVKAGDGGPPTTERTPGSVLIDLARDMVDGEIDAAEFGTAIAGLPDSHAMARILSQDPLRLRIPNSSRRIAQLNLQLKLESVVTAPGLHVNWGQLVMPPAGRVRLIVDADGDGVADPQDGFPDDAAEWSDADGDGVGDNADAYPRNAACWAVSDGDGQDCLVTRLVGASVRQIVAGEDGVVYVSIDGAPRILRFDAAAGHFLPAIELTHPELPRLLAYSTAHRRLYTAQGTEIRFVEPSRSLVEEKFASTLAPIQGLVSAGEFVVAQETYEGEGNEVHSVFDRNGRTAHTGRSSYYSGSYAWNAVNERLYFFRDNVTPNDLLWEAIDQATGVITARGDSPYHSSFDMVPPITVSGDGAWVMLGTGDIYDVDTMEVVGAITSGQTHARWPAGSGPITLSPVGAGQTLLERWSEGRKVEEARLYAGTALGLFDFGDRFLIVLETQDAWRFVVYVPSDDSDGDGVANDVDAFPNDPAASQDGDRDGYPDAWNPGRGAGDSTTGLVLDAHPESSACFRVEQGDGTRCNVAEQIPDYQPDEIVADGEGTLYLLDRDAERVYRWSAVETDHLDPLVVGSRGLAPALEPRTMAWSSAHHRLYLGYPNGRLTYVTPDAGMQEREFATIGRVVGGLVGVGEFVLAQEDDGFRYGRSIFDRDGVRTDWVDRSDFSSAFEWSEANGRVYYFRDPVSPNDLLWEAIDQTTGLMTTRDDSPYHGDFEVAPPVRVSPDGGRVLLGTGDVYDGRSLEEVASLPAPLIDAAWLDDGSLITIRDGEEGATLVEQWSEDLVLYFAGSIDHAPLRVVATAGRVAVVTHDGRAPRFSIYVPTDDGDDDGVVNAEDAFPLDPAASRDSDGDGHPDDWNPGRDAEDSTSGLVLDAFPFESACQLPEHALPGRSDVCDIANGIPRYEPDEIVVDDAGTIYLFDREEAFIYRWSIDARYHLDPVAIGDAPNHIVYSRTHDRLYLGYASGAITWLDPRVPETGERAFAETTRPVEGLAAVGEFVLAQDDSGLFESHYLFDREGRQTQKYDRTYHSPVFEWSDTNGRVYFFRGGSRPEDLYWEAIDQATGRKTGEGETPYHFEYEILPPIRVSPDGARVLLGSGDVYDGLGLEWIEALPIQPVDAAWLTAGSLLTVREDGDGSTLLEQWRSMLVPENFQRFEGRPIRILVHGDVVVVITEQDGRPAFTVYTPTDDGDGDGVPMPDDAFPLDPAASQDADGDGYPDAWNPGRSADDSSTGLMLDAFPSDSACQLPDHAVPGYPDRCDILSSIPSYSPSQLVLGDDGTIHLFSRELGRIFRWSIADRLDLNPVFVGGTPFPGGVPDHLAYSSAHDRLYLGYASGAITQLDASDPTVGEQAFATTARSVRGLAAVGAFLLAQDDRGSDKTHSVFDRNGQATDRWASRPYAGIYGRSEVDDRVYFFRDGRSPSALRWESIDQGTGALSGAGDSPYAGRFVAPPIRISPDGTRAVLGSGDVWSTSSLEVIDALPNRPVDATWLADGSLITIRAHEPGLTLVEQWSPVLIQYNVEEYEGGPIALVASGDEIVVITDRSGRPSFGFYRVSDDGDNDGVPNDDDAYPMDPAASLDTDHDGYPDAWNAGMDASDSTLGLVLDAFPDEFACQLPEHGVDGICDFRFVLPASRDEAFCRSDERVAPGTSGTLDLPTISDFIPLCDGWMLIADEASQAIRIQNVVEDRLGTSYALGGTPGDLELDEDAKRLYVALPDRRSLAVLDLVDGEVTFLPLGIDIHTLALGEAGDLFLLSPSGSARQNLHRLAAGSSVLEGPWLIWGNYLRIHPVTAELLTADSFENVRRHSFASGGGPLLLQTATAGTPTDLAVSSDGLHLAVATAPESRPPYTISDLDASDLFHVRGSYAVGLYPMAVAFDLPSRRILVSNRDSLLIFDVDTFQEIDHHTTPRCLSEWEYRVGFSRGDRIAFGSRTCGLLSRSTRIDWFVPTP